VTHAHAKSIYPKRVGWKDRVETNVKTDGIDRKFTKQKIAAIYDFGVIPASANYNAGLYISFVRRH